MWCIPTCTLTCAQKRVCVDYSMVLYLHKHGIYSCTHVSHHQNLHPIYYMYIWCKLNYSMYHVCVCFMFYVVCTMICTSGVCALGS